MNAKNMALIARLVQLTARGATVGERMAAGEALMARIGEWDMTMAMKEGGELAWVTGELLADELMELYHVIGSIPDPKRVEAARIAKLAREWARTGCIPTPQEWTADEIKAASAMM